MSKAINDKWNSWLEQQYQLKEQRTALRPEIMSLTHNHSLGKKVSDVVMDMD